MSINSLLEKGLEDLGLTVSPQPLLDYLSLLLKWNQAYNLTAVRDLESMVTRHLLDSLAIVPWIEGQRILDVGSGAGFPGIPLALNNPSLQVVLLDSNGKKTRFLEEAKRKLKLTNVEIVRSRIEMYQAELNFDTITSRAFSALEPFVDSTQTLLKSSGIWLAMKGHYPEAELAMLNYPYHVYSYSVPGLLGQRCCVVINNK